MDITPLVPEGQKIIQRYGDGKFVVNDAVFQQPLLVLSQNVFAWDAHKDADYKQLLTLIEQQQNHIEVLLFGMGEQVESPLPAHVKEALKSYHISMDVMNTGAACRTYNVLMAEGRKVAAVLIPVM